MVGGVILDDCVINRARCEVHTICERSWCGARCVSSASNHLSFLTDLLFYFVPRVVWFRGFASGTQGNKSG
jgi:hypothetical protein